MLADGVPLLCTFSPEQHSDYIVSAKLCAMEAMFAPCPIVLMLRANIGIFFRLDEC